MVATTLETGPFVRWLTDQLASAGCSRRELARRTGVSATSIAEYVSGGRRPLPDSCRRLARYFGVAEDIVLSLAGHRSAPVPEQIDEHDSFLHFLRDQPAEVLDEIERWVRPFVRSYWETRRPERLAGGPVELSIQLRWDDVLVSGRREVSP